MLSRVVRLGLLRSGLVIGVRGGALKIQDQKMHDVKMKDYISGPEMQDLKMRDLLGMLDRYSEH